MTPSKLLKRLRIDDPDGFRLAAFDPADTGGLDKDDAQAMLADDLKRLAELQQRLYTDGRWALLVVLQGMDAAGKDGVIEHVMTGLNPQGCNVHAFKAPSEEDLAHDFSGARRSASRSEDGSASSTARTTRRPWSCAASRPAGAAENPAPAGR